MKKYKIFYIDDQSFALAQLINAIPQKTDYELTYVQRINDIVMDDFDLVILDFYLDKDGKTALDIVNFFLWMQIISFSTSQSKNMLMLKKWAMYGVQKLKHTNENIELTKVMGKVFA